MSKVVIENRPAHRDTPSRGSVLTRLKPISNFIDAGAKRDVESVVKKIEQIRRHGETTIFERHADTSISLSVPELAKLKSLCKKLVDLSSSERATERYASEEIIRLSVEDPRIHFFLKELQLFPSGSYDLSMHTCCSFARFTIDDASVEVHGLWSDLFQISRGTVEGSAQTNDTMAEYLERKNFYFTDYLQNRELSFLSARYLRHALKLRVVGNALYFIINIWRRYLKIAKADAQRLGDDSIVEWSNLDGCFQSLPSGALRTAYAPPPLLGELLAHIITYRRADRVPIAFQIFFDVPHIDIISPDKGLFSRISIDVTHFRLLPVYRAELFRALREFPHESPLLPGEQNGRILDAVNGMILFGDQIWVDYCEAAMKIWDYHYRNLSSESYTLPLSYDFHNLPQGSRVALATFLAASLLSDWPRTLARAPPDLVSDVQDFIGPLSLPFFDNVPYIRRYRIKDTGRVFITSDHLPEPPTVLIKNFDEKLLYDFTIDTLPLKRGEAQWFHVDGRNTLFDVSLPPFGSGPYTPILAVDPKENPSYVAATKVGKTYHFTHTTDISSSVIYADEVGDEHESQDFLILVKKCRSTVKDNITNTTIGRWLPFWPIKDPSYVALSESAKSDDEHLEAILNSFRRESHT